MSLKVLDLINEQSVKVDGNAKEVEILTEASLSGFSHSWVCSDQDTDATIALLAV